MSISTKKILKKAKEQYQLALTEKDDPYAKGQLDIIDEKIREQAEGDEQKKQYEKILAKAKEKFESEEYVVSRELFNRALRLNPNDAFPNKKINEIDKILADKAAKSKLDSLAADQLNSRYNVVLVKANNLFDKQLYSMAKEKYEAALEIKPEEKLPKERIEEIEEALAKLKEDKVLDTALANEIFANNEKVYGESVEIKEAEAGLLIQRTAVDQLYDKAQSYAEFKDSLAEIGQIDQDSSLYDKYILFSKIEFMAESAPKYFAEKGNKGREDNIEGYKDYNERIETRGKNSQEQMAENNSELNIQIDEMKERVIEEYGDKGENVEENYAAFKKRKEKVRDLYETLAEKDATSGTEIASDLALRKEITIQKNDVHEDERQQNIKEGVAYQDIQFDNRLKNTEKTLENNSEIAFQIDERKEHERLETENKGEGREVNVEKYKKFKDVLTDHNQKQQDVELRHTSEINNQLEASKDNDLSKTKVSTYGWENNVSKFNKLQDIVAETSSEIGKNDGENDYYHYEQFEEVKEIFQDKYDHANDVAAVFPEGVTEKVYQRKNNKGEVIETTIVRYVVKNNQGYEYKRVQSRWGTVHFREHQAISEASWDIETSVVTR